MQAVSDLPKGIPLAAEQEDLLRIRPKLGKKFAGIQSGQNNVLRIRTIPCGQLIFRRIVERCMAGQARSSNANAPQVAGRFSVFRS